MNHCASPLPLHNAFFTQHVNIHRWHKTNCLIEERTRRFEELYRLWEQYEKEYKTAEGWIDSREREVNDLLLEEDEPDNQEQHLQNARVSNVLNLSF